jgi:hypothetical protein
VDNVSKVLFVLNADIKGSYSAPRLICMIFVEFVNMLSNI